MSNKDLFSNFEDSDDPKATNEKAVEVQPTATPPTEVAAAPTQQPTTSQAAYDTLTEDQKIILGDIASSFSLDINEVVIEFNKAHADKSLNRWRDKPDKIFKLSKAMMNSVLEEKSKIQKYPFMALGKSMFYGKDSNMMISTIVGVVEYEKSLDGTLHTVKERKAVKSFDRGGEKIYQCLKKSLAFHTYETLLIKDNKNEFNLSEYTNFDIGTPPEGKFATMSDLELYTGLGIKVVENWKDTGYSKNNADGFQDPCDLKAVQVIVNKPNPWSAPKDFPDVQSLPSSAVDFEGNNLTLYFSDLPETKVLFDQVEKDQKIIGVAIGTIRKDKNENDTMSVFNFIKSEE